MHLSSGVSVLLCLKCIKPDLNSCLNDISHIACKALLKLPDEVVVGLGQCTCLHGVTVHVGLLDFVEQHQLDVERAFSKSLPGVQACPLLPACCQMHTTVRKLSRL